MELKNVHEKIISNNSFLFSTKSHNSSIKSKIMSSSSFLPYNNKKQTIISLKENIIPSRNYNINVSNNFKKILKYTTLFPSSYSNDKFSNSINESLNKLIKSNNLESNSILEYIKHNKKIKSYEEIETPKIKKKIPILNLEETNNNKIIKDDIKLKDNNKLDFLDLDNYYCSLMNDSAKTTYTSKFRNTINTSTNKSNKRKSEKFFKIENLSILTSDNFRKKNKPKINPNFSTIENISNNNLKIDDNNKLKIKRIRSARGSIHLENYLIIRNDRNQTHKLPENLLVTKSRLQKEINNILSKNYAEYNINNNQILTSLQETKKSAYTQEIIEKIKIINNFIENQPPERFLSNIVRHRKIFVIIDGTTVFNKTIIKGEFIDIPTRRYLSFLQNKKERMLEYYSFLVRCQQILKCNVPFKNIFLINGINVFDLMDIPESDKCLFVSVSNIFRGIHLFFNQKITSKTLKEKDYKLLKIQENKKLIVKYQKPKFKPYVTFFSTRARLKKKKNKMEKKFKTKIKKINYLNDQSFTFGITDKLEKNEFEYYSDNESNNKKKFNFQKKYPNLFQQLIYFNEEEKNKLIEKETYKKNKRIKNFLKKRKDENTYEGLDKLLQEYNKNRGNRYKIKIHQNMKCTLTDQEKQIKMNSENIFNQLLKRLHIFDSYYKGMKDDIDIDYDKFKKKVIKRDKNKDFILNKFIENLADKKMHKFYPDLISMNIPRVLNTFPKLKRTSFYEIFVQFKNLLIICISITKNLNLIKKGIDFDTFFNCIPQIKSQGIELAKKIYKTLNKLNTKYLNWEEFLTGMLTLKSKYMNEKIDTFLSIIDSDGNGLLSFDEVYEISKGSLKRVLGEDNENENNEENIVNILATFFANLIFQLVDMPIDKEIPMDKIREKILEGKEAAEYLQMFICADSFL